MLLSTKFFTPHRRTDTVQRPRLLALLDRSLTSRVTLVSAPAGFGKTTLVAEWLAQAATQTVGPHQSPLYQGLKGCWLSLDEEDNDPARFLTYLVATLQQIDARLGVSLQTLLQTPQPPTPETLITLLINDLSLRQERVMLVLDDYHQIETAAIQALLIFLIDQLPPNCHLILTTRSDPPWPLARWRVRRQLVEIRENDLRFTTDEIATFLAGALPQQLSATSISELAARTEGWVAGLQLATLSMQEHPDPASFIDAFHGNHAYIVDYLSEEVLQRQPPSRQAFLRITSILPRMCAPLCNLLTARTDSQPILEELERMRLFVIPLDSERHWYRYHQLFADVLQTRFQGEERQALITLHTKAAHWFAEQGLLREAMHHALHAHCFELVIHLLETHGDTLLKQGEYVTLLGWLERLPDRQLPPRLGLLHAAVQIALNNLDHAEQSLREAEQALPAYDTAQALHGELAARRTAIAIYRGNWSQAAQQAEQALAALPAAETFLRGQVLFHLAVTQSWRGDLQSAHATHRAAYTMSNRAGDFNNALLARFNQTLIRQDTGGDLTAVVAAYQATLNWATAQQIDQLPNIGLIHVELARIYYEWNDLATAYGHAQQAQTITERTGVRRLIAYNAECYALILFGRGEQQAARRVLQRAQQAVNEYKLSPRYSSWLTLAQVRLWLMQGDLAAAATWAAQSGLTLDDEVTMLQMAAYLALAQVYIATGAAASTMPLLNKIRQLVESQGRQWLLIRLLVQLALAEQAIGNLAAAISTLTDALTLAAPNKLIRTFLDEGTAMAALLAHCQRQQTSWSPALRAYVTGLIRHYPTNGTNGTARQPAPSLLPHPTTPPAPLIEKLSERELEVLRLVAAGHSNSQIAEQLIVTVGTIKRHLNNIFGKLGVNSRTAAIARGRALGLL